MLRLSQRVILNTTIPRTNPGVLLPAVDETGLLKMATTMSKSNMAVYLSCTNVRLVKTYCEVKLKVCVPLHYEVVVICRIVRVTYVL